MKGKLCIFTAALLCSFLLSCAPAARLPTEPAPSAHAAPFYFGVHVTATPLPTPAISLAPTASPVPTASPAPTASPVPEIDADWYREREKVLRETLARNGSFASDAAIAEAIDRMWIDPTRPMVALTFDDGPVPGITDRILEILASYQARATFFILGTRLDKPEAMELVRRTLAQGCEIGNHTWQHERLTEQSFSGQCTAMARTNEIVFDETGYVIRSLRPPGGYSNGDTLRAAKKNGMAVVKWSQSGDVHQQDPVLIAQNVQQQIVNGKKLEDGDIILLHDTKERMIPAVEIIVPQLIDAGYQLVTVSELLHCSEDGFEPGKSYRHR